MLHSLPWAEDMIFQPEENISLTAAPCCFTSEQTCLFTMQTIWQMFSLELQYLHKHVQWYIQKYFINTTTACFHLIKLLLKSFSFMEYFKVTMVLLYSWIIFMLCLALVFSWFFVVVIFQNVKKRNCILYENCLRKTTHNILHIIKTFIIMIYLKHIHLSLIFILVILLFIFTIKYNYFNKTKIFLL